MNFYYKKSPQSYWAQKIYPIRCFNLIDRSIDDAKLTITLYGASSDFTYEFIPNSCVRNIFGSDDWNGSKNWPEKV